MKTKPKVLILKTDGTNCDNELAYAFSLAGGEPQFVHVNELRQRKSLLKKFQILAVPGGFSYGDDIVSGKILAVELTSFFQEEMQTFIDRKNTAMMGVCNGFQVLIRTGVLPFRTLGTMHATLTNNDSGHFECRWVKMKVEQSRAEYLYKITGIIDVAVNHGEGKLFADEETLKKIEEQKLVAFRYVDAEGKPTQTYPDNPNGALHAIAGLTDPTGRILGLMPHPEKFVVQTQHPNWRRMAYLPAGRQVKVPHGLPIFKNMVSFVKNA